MNAMIDTGRIAEHNTNIQNNLQADYEALGGMLARRGQDIEKLTALAQTFAVALPSWGVGTGGTRFARFPGIGEPRNVFEKMEDCAVIHQLTHATPTVSLHFPWDKTTDPAALREIASGYGLGFDTVNSNTFQDQAGQAHSYKNGSLTANNPAARAQAIAHNIDCITLGRALGSNALTVWIGDGANFPGQHNLRGALERYLDSMREIYSALPSDWLVYIEHKLFEPAFYATTIADWGTSFACATELGPKAKCLVDLGHHAPNTNIEMIVARLAQFGKLGGFHFNDSKYGDDDLDSGSINPFQLFLIFNELADVAQREGASFKPSYMLDQSHNVTDPIESLMSSAIEVQRAFIQSAIVDRTALQHYQEQNDVLQSAQTLKHAFRTDVSPILAMARFRSGATIDPIGCYRSTGYRAQKGQQRPPKAGISSSGII
ncbi:L-rhamnose catabolism isomerase [Glaciimonas sp. Gout2]|uniref:L-rhamnose catabolism isomerase n=2 Tax=Glaciimonas TaxID=1229970 RepID=UPI002AB4E7F6|nr:MULTISPECIES: L-rhamnose catabolism isomerase [unclassified Glaciimonas]MDY7548555.1 L-rhamnose catabolism isomerase [Glaciimonas sp. CA11.2]MEB0013742.1 L-rhamnose catabolism isomerase [Glaciimonas sp. Cout2]MEB0083347.1 L-rhamnose catabolism isomerase [Glaciimonas sp. Gout2]